MKNNGFFPRLLKGKAKYVILAIIAISILVVALFQKVWKAGKSYSARDGMVTYQIDTLSNGLVLNRSEVDPSTHAKHLHAYKIMAYHDAWVELDTSGTGLEIATATILQDKMIFYKKYRSSVCNPCEARDTAFEITVSDKK
jgi:hypothetical protein